MTSLASMTSLELTAGPARVVVALEEGARLASLSVAGLDLLVGRAEASGDPMRWGAFPMAPWAARVRRGRFTFDHKRHQLKLNMAPNAIHGTVYHRRWEVENVTDNSCEVACDLRPGWPFDGFARQRIELDASAVRLTLEVHAADRVMPATCGWHPWWRRDLAFGGALEVDAELAGRWDRDSDGLPTGKVAPVGQRPPQGWDDCFDAGPNPPVLRWPGALEITVESDCPQLVVYDQPANAICVEPQTGPPDALNLGCSVVEPGCPLVAHTTWSWALG